MSSIRAWFDFPHPVLPEAVRRLGVLSAHQRHKLEPWGLSQTALRAGGFCYHPSGRLWCLGPVPRLLDHQLAVGEVVVQWAELGHHLDAVTIAPCLPYRSPAGGRRSLDPDALLHGGGLPVAVEVDRGTESGTVLRHKWWRYREYGQEVVALPLIVVAPTSRLRLIASTLARAGLERVGLGSDVEGALGALAAGQR